MACTQWLQPEQDSQAKRTWSNIVENSTKQHSHASDPKHFQSQLAALDYIPLESGTNGDAFVNRTGSQDNKKLKRKLPNDKTQLHNYNGLVSPSDSSCSTPWKTRNYVQDPTGLNEEIHDFFNYIKPRPEEDAVRIDVVERVKVVIKQLWPQAKVELYGSCQTGLYLPTSDIDLVVHGKWESLPLRTLENELIEQEIADANSIRVLDKATVPIIKVTDKMTQVKIDISFNMNNGVQSADMIKTYMDQYPALPYLTFVLKQFLVNRDLNEVFCGGISSYTVVLMVVSFFQHSEHFKKSEKEVNLGVLLIEFFELYGKKFNYNNVGICLLGSGSYFNKEMHLGKSLATTTHLCIADPLTQGNYIGKGSFRINEIKRAFEWACSTLTHGVLNNIPGNESSSILGRITHVRPEAIEQRQRMLRHSRCISAGVPSYASVATRNTTRTSTIRSIQDAKYKSESSEQRSKPRYNDQRNERDVYSKSPHPASPTEVHSRHRSRHCVSRDSQMDNDWRKPNSAYERSSHNTKKITPEKSSRSDRLSPNQKHSSPKRSPMSESCGMRSKTVKTVKEIRQRPERLLC